MADPIAARLEELSLRQAQVRRAGDEDDDGVPVSLWEEYVGDHELLLDFVREVASAHKYVPGETSEDVDTKVGAALQKLARA